MKLISLFSAVALSAIGCSKPTPVAVKPSCSVTYRAITDDPEIVCTGGKVFTWSSPNGETGQTSETDAMQAELVKFKRGIAEQSDDSEKDYAAKMGWDKSKPPVRITLRDGAHAWGCHPDDTLVGVSRVPQEDDVDGRDYTLAKKGFWCLPSTPANGFSLAWTATGESVTRGKGADGPEEGVHWVKPKERTKHRGAAKDAPKPETQLWSGTFSNPKDEHGCTYPFNWSEDNSTCVFNLQFADKSMGGMECSSPTGEVYGKLRCSYKPDPKVSK